MVGALSEGTGSSEDGLPLWSDSGSWTSQHCPRHSGLYKSPDPFPVCLKPFSFSVQMFLLVSNLYSFEKIISVFHDIVLLYFLPPPIFNSTRKANSLIRHH